MAYARSHNELSAPELRGSHLSCRCVCLIVPTCRNFTSSPSQQHYLVNTVANGDFLDQQTQRTVLFSKRILIMPPEHTMVLRSRTLTNSAAEFIETRPEESLVAVDSLSTAEFVPELDRFVLKPEVPDHR